MLKKKLILKIKKRKKFRLKFIKRSFFDVPLKFIFEKMSFYKKRLPNSGDVLIVKFYDKITGLKMSFFRLYVCFGICLSTKKKLLLSTFLLRNSFLHNSLEFKFFLFSPLLLTLNIYTIRRKKFRKSKLFFLRLKKLRISSIL